jgi:hypothetical protein
MVFSHLPEKVQAGGFYLEKYAQVIIDISQRGLDRPFS